MKVLVTGGNGFLSANVTRELIKHGYAVRVMIRPSADHLSLQGVQCEFFYGNITNIDDVIKAVEGCNYVIHAAAEASHKSHNLKSYLPVNVDGTRNVIEAVIKHKVRKLIYVSTANTFGFGTKTRPGNELVLSKYPFTRSAYVKSKIKAQELVLKYVNENRINAVVVNPTFMIGPYDAKPSSGKIILMNYGKKIAFLPPGGKNFVHVKDVAFAICNAIDNGKNGECYLLANENLTYMDFYRKIQKITGYKQYLIKLPSFLTIFAGCIGNILSWFGLKTDLSCNNTKMLCIGNYYSAEKAVKELNMPQTSVDIAISEAVKWFRRNNYLK